MATEIIEEDTRPKPKRELKWCPLCGNACMREGCAWWIQDSTSCAVHDLAILSSDFRKASQ